MIRSKLPNVGTTIFTEMSALATKHHAINLSQGFPNYEPDARLRKLVAKHMNEGRNQYAPMQGLRILRDKISEKFDFLYGVKVDPLNEINITAGGTQAIFTSIATFVHKGDEVIVLEPAFDCYNPAIEMMGAKVVAYEMEGPDFSVDWEKVGHLITDRTSMIIINTPHNPTGSILREDDFVSLEKLVRDKDIIVLSDEVYEHLIYDGEQHCSIVKYSGLRSKSIAIFSFGKTFHCTGWKLGYAIMPEHLMAEFRKVHQFNVFSVNSFVQWGIAEYLEDRSSYLGLSQFYQKKRDLLTKFLHGSRFKVIPSRGSYFILCDYSEISNKMDTEFAKWMTIECGIACIPISVFYHSGRQDRYVRFCFAKTDDVLVRAGQMLQTI